MDLIEFIDTTPLTLPSTTIPIHKCPPNEIAVGCDYCREAFCCDSGRVSFEFQPKDIRWDCDIVIRDVKNWFIARTLERIMGCQNGMMKPALGCDLEFFRVCSDAKCVCDIANGYARALDDSCVKGSDCQQYFTGK